MLDCETFPQHQSLAPERALQIDIKVVFERKPVFLFLTSSVALLLQYPAYSEHSAPCTGNVECVVNDGTPHTLRATFAVVTFTLSLLLVVSMPVSEKRHSGFTKFALFAQVACQPMRKPWYP
jgi:hypothetical protein